MSTTGHASSWTLTSRVALLLVGATIAVFALGVRAPAAQACGAVQVCAWTGPFYTGAEYYLTCPSGTGYSLGLPTAYSAKNNCGGQYIRIGWAEGGSTNWKACMNPGGDRPDPGRFNVYQRVGSC